MELMLRKKARWFIISLFITMFLMVSLSIAAIFIYMNNKVTPAVSKQDNNVIKEDNGLERELAYLKNILQGQTKYQHQYSLVYLKLINGRYIGRFELNFYPDDKWYLKTLAADIINLFRKHNNGMLCEFSFSYKGKIYLKTVLTEFPPKLIHHFS
jgi:hypothetical protein